jgi:hypothetical protein
MYKLMRSTLLIFIFQILLSISTLTFAETLSSEVTVPSGLKCKVYLHSSEKTPKGSPIILDIQGNGIYGRRADSLIAAEANYLFSENQAFVVTYDKPGIEGNEVLLPGTHLTDPQNFRFNSDAFYRHTQKDLTLCATQALEWAISQKEIVGESNPVILTGGSEGAQIQIRLVHGLLKNHQEALLKRIRSVILTGTLMEGWEDLKRFQLGEKSEEFFDAIKRQDANYFIKNKFNVGLAYYEDIFNTPVIRDQLMEILHANLQTTDFHFFHGLNDEKVSVKPVQEFEGTYQDLCEKPKSFRCNFDFRYYLAGHRMSLAANNDMLAIVLMDLKIR